MAPIKLTTTVWSDSLLPKDGIQINPVLNGTGPTTDAKQIADDWIVAFKSWAGIGTTRQVTVKAYDVSKPKPNYPLYERTDNPGLAPASPTCRELALCLSFYSHDNVKRKRGRLYLPVNWLVASPSIPVRPGQSVIDKAASLVPILTALGGVDVDWSIWSKVDGVARAATNWWVDNEWDIQRMRGLRGTARTEGTTTEDTTRERALV